MSAWAPALLKPHAEERMNASTASQVSLVSLAPAVSEFPRLLAEMVPQLRGRALQLTGNAATADDLVQDTVERALRFASQYERGTNLRAWTGQILFSLFVTRYRRTRREKTALQSLASDPHAWTSPERFKSPEASMTLTPSADAAIEALPQGFRTVVRLVDLEERSYREAAEELGVPVGTVMSRLHRGRRLLAASLAA
jgi:RNA polymerase sigma-70 factor (ECF subfamily)